MTLQWFLVGISFLLCVLLAWHFFFRPEKNLKFITLFGLACGVLFLPHNLSLHVFLGSFYLLSVGLWAKPGRLAYGLLIVISGLILGLLWLGFLVEPWFWLVVSLLIFGVVMILMLQGHFAQLPLWLYALLVASTLLLMPHWSNNLWLAVLTMAIQLTLFLMVMPTSENQSLAVINVTEIQAAERSRIYQNIHDDVGAELLRLIYLLDDEGQKKQVKDIMQGLRRAVAQTTQITMDVQQLSDDMVELCRQRLLEANIECETEITNSYNHVFNNTLPTGLLRIMNELLSNIIRHATAQKVHFQLISDQQQLTLRLTDNGCGLDPQKTITNTGRGLRGLQKRAVKMGADISWRNNPSGGLTTSVRYLWR